MGPMGLMVSRFLMEAGHIWIWNQIDFDHKRRHPCPNMSKSITQVFVLTIHFVTDRLSLEFRMHGQSRLHLEVLYSPYFMKTLKYISKWRRTFQTGVL